MSVELKADPKDFRIVELNTRAQAILPGHVAQWDFDVTPRRGGEHKLRLLVSLDVQQQDQSKPSNVAAYDHTIPVRSAPFYAVGRFLSSNWKWLGATLIVPTVAWALTNSIAPHWADQMRGMLGLPERAQAGTASSSSAPQAQP
jgi:hypothetical protein